MKELKIDRDKMLKAAESCDTVKKVFEELWPEEFEDVVHDEYGAKYEWHDSTYMVCKVGFDKKIFICVNKSNYYGGIYGGDRQSPLDGISFRYHLTELVKIHKPGLKYIGNAFKGDTNA